MLGASTQAMRPFGRERDVMGVHGAGEVCRLRLPCFGIEMLSSLIKNKQDMFLLRYNCVDNRFSK